MKSPREIIGGLLQAVEENNLDWNVTINQNIVRAVYESPISETRVISYMIFYNNNKASDTKLIVSITTDKGSYKSTMPVIIVGGEDNPIISREVCYLLEKIMMSGGFNIDDDEIRVGDRVVVTEEQNFKGKEIGQKGTAMSENIINGKKYFLICFDLRFSPDLVYHAEIRKYNCWLFEPKQLKKIKKERWIS